MSHWCEAITILAYQITLITTSFINITSISGSEDSISTIYSALLTSDFFTAIFFIFCLVRPSLCAVLQTVEQSALVPVNLFSDFPQIYARMLKNVSSTVSSSNSLGGPCLSCTETTSPVVLYKLTIRCTVE